jgi:hypothetical protein
MHAWVIEGDPTQTLDLSGLGLSSLPPHLPTKFLNLINNNLTSIPNIAGASNCDAPKEAFVASSRKVP